MRLKLKVAIATAGITALAASSVGFASAYINQQAGLALLEERLDQIVADVKKNESDPLSEALFLASTLEVSLGFVELDGTVTPLQDAAGELSGSSLVTREIDLGSDQKLKFALSTKAIDQAAADSALAIGFISLLAGCLAGGSSVLIMRRDLRLIQNLAKESRNIAAGSNSHLKNEGGSEELIALADALNSMVDRLQGANQKMQDFLSDASHELRTPLTVVRGYLEIIQSQELAPEQISKYASRSLEEALRMQVLINDILLLAELGTDSEIDIENFDVAEIVKSQLDDLRILQPGREITFENNTSRTISGSPKLISQFFANVFANIRNHTPSNSRISVTLESDENGFTFDIQDAGPGIEWIKENQQLTAFHRFERSRSRKTGGSGLGLSIMAKIVQSHRGDLVLSRSEFGGLRVTARLPG